MASCRLDISNLSCDRGERALFRGLGFVLESGAMARVLGENGSGKTTLLRTIAGLHQPLRGRVAWQAPLRSDGEMPTLREHLCFVGHDNALNGALTPVENLDMLMRLAGYPVSRDSIAHALAALGLADIAARACRRLSAGQKRRVSLTRLWLTGAPLWLLDEPASALDVGARAALGDRIAKHAAAGGIVLFTTHETLALDGVSPRSIELPTC